MKIPFDIKYRPQIESGEFKVESENGHPVRILCWDARNFFGWPIIGLYFNGEVDLVIEYNIHGASGNRNTSLVIVTPDPVKSTDLCDLEEVWMRGFKNGANANKQEILEWADAEMDKCETIVEYEFWKKVIERIKQL